MRPVYQEFPAALSVSASGGSPTTTRTRARFCRRANGLDAFPSRRATTRTAGKVVPASAKERRRSTTTSVAGSDGLRLGKAAGPVEVPGDFHDHARSLGDLRHGTEGELVSRRGVRTQIAVHREGDHGLDAPSLWCASAGTRTCPSTTS